MIRKAIVADFKSNFSKGATPCETEWRDISIDLFTSKFAKKTSDKYWYENFY